MKCLIIAAGKGNRLRQKVDSKPLFPLLGVPLIERVIRNALKAGMDDIYVVTGYKGEKVNNFLSALAKRLNVTITTIKNMKWESSGNGTSIMLAHNYLKKPFLLLMSDHLFDWTIIRQLLSIPLKEAEICLAVDGNINNPLIDLEDVTRVRYELGKIKDIGKELKLYNGFDTGIFYCTPAIFDAIKESTRLCDTSLTGAVRHLTTHQKVNSVDIDGRYWIDVDDPKSLKKAEKALLDQLKDKPNDGPISRYLNRPLSIRISKLLVNYPITPNLISFFSFVCSLIAAGLFAFGRSYFTLLIGGLLTHFASVIDGCDGEIARLKFKISKYGGWFDAVLDRYADVFLLFGLTWHVFMLEGSSLVLFIGFLAIIGSFMLSYTADKYDGLMLKKFTIEGSRNIRIGRDVRLFLIFLGAIFNQVFLVLVIIAVVFNVETIRRLIVCRDYE